MRALPDVPTTCAHTHATPHSYLLHVVQLRGRTPTKSRRGLANFYSFFFHLLLCALSAYELSCPCSLFLHVGECKPAAHKPLPDLAPITSYSPRTTHAYASGIPP